MGEIKMEENCRKESSELFSLISNKRTTEEAIKIIERGDQRKTDTKMADQEEEHEVILEETSIEKVEVDPSTLTPTSPEVISR